MRLIIWYRQYVLSFVLCRRSRPRHCCGFPSSMVVHDQVTDFESEDADAPAPPQVDPVETHQRVAFVPLDETPRPCSPDSAQPIKSASRQRRTSAPVLRRSNSQYSSHFTWSHSSLRKRITPLLSVFPSSAVTAKTSQARRVQDKATVLAKLKTNLATLDKEVSLHANQLT